MKLRGEAGLRSRSGTKWCMLVAGFSISIACYVSYYHHRVDKSQSNQLVQETEPQLISEPPNILLLKRLLDDSAGLNEWFRLHLLKDESGNRLKDIEDSERGQVERINTEVFRRWLDGRGRKPVTWNTLINVLSEVKLNTAANNLNSSINASVLNTPSSLYAHSEAYFEFSKELKAYYQDQHTIRFKLLHNVSAMPFLEVDLKDTLNGSFLNLSATLGDIDSNLYKRLLITGKPGSGKTTLMRHLAKQWASGKVLLSCLLLFLIDLQSFDTQESQSIRSVTKLLELSHFNDLGNLNNVLAEGNRKDQAGMCLLFDGYDEILTQDGKNFIYNTFFNTKKYVCILASRPYDFKEDTKIKHIDIVGYNQQKLQGHLNKLLMSDTEENIRIKQLIKKSWNEHPKVKDLCSLPLHLAMMIYVARSQTNEGIEFNTRTQIYTAFINSTIQYYRSWETSILWKCPHGHIQSNLCAAFKELQNAAFGMLFNNETKFPENRIIQKTISNLGFVKVTKVESTWDQVMYTFSHATFLEYFSALYLTGLSQEEQLYYITLYPQPQSLWSFFFGLLNDNNSYNSRTPPLLRRISTHYHRKSLLRYDPCDFEVDMDFFDIVQEAVQTREEQEMLLQLTGVIVNSTLCVYSSTYKSHSVFKNLNIHLFNFRAGSLDSFVRFNGQHYSLSEQYTKFQLCFEESRSCSSIPGVTHFRADVYDHYAITKLDNMLKAFTNLVSLDIQIYPGTRRYYQTIALILQKLDHLEVLNILPMDCKRLSTVIRELGESQPSFNSLTIVAKNFQGYVNKMHIQSSMTNQLVYLITYFLFPELGPQMQILTDIETNIICHTSPLVKRLTNPVRLQSLKIKGTKLFEEHNLYLDLPTYIDGLQGMSYLYLSEVDIMETKLDRFLTNMSKTHHLLTLEISRTNLNDHGLEKLSENMPTNLQELILYTTNLTDLGIASLAKALRNMHNLQSLRLSGNNITGNGVNLLVEALMPHNHLRSLDLSYNWHIMENKTAFLTLAHLTNLRQLNVGGCKLDAETLIEVLKNFTHLESLVLCKQIGQRLSDDKNIRHVIRQTINHSLTEVKHLAFLDCH